MTGKPLLFWEIRKRSFKLINSVKSSTPPSSQSLTSHLNTLLPMLFPAFKVEAFKSCNLLAFFWYHHKPFLVGVGFFDWVFAFYAVFHFNLNPKLLKVPYEFQFQELLVLLILFLKYYHGIFLLSHILLLFQQLCPLY